jgi:hypothetical protein
MFSGLSPSSFASSFFLLVAVLVSVLADSEALLTVQVIRRELWREVYAVRWPSPLPYRLVLCPVSFPLLYSASPRSVLALDGLQSCVQSIQARLVRQVQPQRLNQSN